MEYLTKTNNLLLLCCLLVLFVNSAISGTNDTGTVASGSQPDATTSSSTDQPVISETTITPSNTDETTAQPNPEKSGLTTVTEPPSTTSSSTVQPETTITSSNTNETTAQPNQEKSDLTTVTQEPPPTTSSSTVQPETTITPETDPCLSSPCKNDGNCSTSDNGEIICTCSHGYTDQYCDTMLYCTHDICENAGTCEEIDGDDYKCNCLPGYTDKNCSADIDDCGPQPCKNGGSCIDQINGYNCTCIPGYTGNDCQTDINDCEVNKCKNGATCIDKVNTFICNCADGFNGTTCEQDIDECQSSPCQHGSTCKDKVAGFQCECLPGFTGVTCETNINECESNPCKNSATCVDDIDGYNCTCMAGFNGTNCEHNINECKIHDGVCQNGGTCIDQINNYTCNCIPGWENDRDCSTNIDECSRKTDECHRNANCTDTQGSYNCTCKTGFTGDGYTCHDVDECSSTTLCKNDGHCINIPGTYHCICNNGWTGKDCSSDINECDDNPCHDQAGCRNTNGSYECTCKDGYRGDGYHCIYEVLFHTNTSFIHGDDDLIGPIVLPNIVYYYGVPYRTLYISMNGYVTLGNQKLNQTYPPENSSGWSIHHIPVIAPFWTDIQTTQPGTGVSYKIFHNETVLRDIQTSLGEKKNVSQSIIITWKQASPYPVSQNGNQKADFQVIITSVGSKTLVMFNYDHEIFTWTQSLDKHVVVGLSDQDYNGNITLNSSNFLQANKQGSGDKNGTWIFDVTMNSKEWESRIQCEEAIHDLPDIIESSRTLLQSCPCDERQVKLDSRFKLSTSSDMYRSYITRFATKDSVLQRCNYGTSGSLLKGYPNGGYANMTSGNEVTTAYARCCNDSNKNCFMFYNKNPSDTCLRYTPPSWSFSWGDPHITTLDGFNYAFNGRGEYTMFSEDKYKITIQARTDMFRIGDTDATVFVGLAVKVGTGETIELLLNRTTKTLNIYINGTLNHTHSNGTNTNIDVNGNIMIFDDLIVLIRPGLAIKIGTGDILDIVVSAPKEFMNGTVKGLLGNYNSDETDDLKPSGNANALNPSSSEESIFHDFGQTWMVKENESLFTYNLSGDGKLYSYYNNESIVPSVFLSDIANLTDNLTDYISHKCSKNFNISQCEGVTACLVDATASCNITAGLESVRLHQQLIDEKNELEHLPPKFNLPDSLYIGYGVNETLKLSFNLTDANVTLKSNDGITKVSSTLSLNVTKDLRIKTMSITLTATDNMNSTSIYTPNIFYCGCEQHEQCDFSFTSIDGPVQDKFYRARCNCTENTDGTFCETKIDKCNSQPCFPGVKCNSSSTDICGQCPAGYTKDGIKCFDNNECYTNTSKCQQKCENIIGSYTCSCESGYGLGSDNHTCIDIDECSDKTNNCTTDTQYCNNIDGGFQCLCLPGYLTDKNGTCVKDRKTFAGVFVFEITESDKGKVKKVIHDLLQEIFKNGVVEIVSLQLNNNNRQRRATSDFQSWSADYIVHEDIQGTATTLNMENKLQTYLYNLPTDDSGNYGSKIEDNTVLKISLKESELYTDASGGICKIPDKVICDEISTDCISSNGIVTCSCKTGFDTWENPYTSCKDYNECIDADAVCKYGECNNLPGSYNCTCQAGYSYNGNTQACIDWCDSTPCLNGGTCVHGDKENQYFCKCDDLWAGTNCQDKNSQAEKLKVIAIAVGSSAGAVCIILVCLLLGMYRRHQNRFIRYSSRSLSGLDFDTAFDLQPASRSKDFPIDDADNTFSIPRPQVTQNVYETTTSEAGRGDDSKKPLTEATGEDENRTTGLENPSFLHSKGTEEYNRNSKRSSKNAYEYF